jgi:8-oxo-dGTP pyrophosphatase MutT (NUDIX family)
MQQATLVLLQEEKSIWLGMKKRGFGEGKWNGFGGKPEKDDQDILHTALRELEEEAGVTALRGDTVKVAELSFYFSANPEWNQVVHIYTLKKWQGILTETEEMKPKRFRHAEIPYSQMWPDDIHWLPRILAGEKIIGSVTFGDDNETKKTYKFKKRILLPILVPPWLSGTLRKKVCA